MSGVKFQQTLRLTRQTSTGPESPVGRAARDVVDMAETAAERIVMTPLPKRENTSSILVERLAPAAAEPATSNGGPPSDVHVAGGDHRGIVVNKSRKTDVASLPPAQLSLEFKVFLVSAVSSLHTQEARTLRFWFKEYVPEQEQARYAQEFFKELVSPLDFPRDYVGFIKKIMKLMQTKYVDLRRVAIELTQLGESSSAPVRPKYDAVRPLRREYHTRLRPLRSTPGPRLSGAPRPPPPEDRPRSQLSRLAPDARLGPAGDEPGSARDELESQRRGWIGTPAPVVPPRHASWHWRDRYSTAPTIAARPYPVGTMRAPDSPKQRHVRNGSDTSRLRAEFFATATPRRSFEAKTPLSRSLAAMSGRSGGQTDAAPGGQTSVAPGGQTGAPPGEQTGAALGRQTSVPPGEEDDVTPDSAPVKTRPPSRAALMASRPGLQLRPASYPASLGGRSEREELLEKAAAEAEAGRNPGSSRGHSVYSSAPGRLATGVQETSESDQKLGGRDRRKSESVQELGGSDQNIGGSDQRTPELYHKSSGSDRRTVESEQTMSGLDQMIPGKVQKRPVREIITSESDRLRSGHEPTTNAQKPTSSGADQSTSEGGLKTSEQRTRLSSGPERRTTPQRVPAGPDLMALSNGRTGQSPGRLEHTSGGTSTRREDAARGTSARRETPLVRSAGARQSYRLALGKEELPTADVRAGQARGDGQGTRGADETGSRAVRRVELGLVSGRDGDRGRMDSAERRHESQERSVRRGRNGAPAGKLNELETRSMIAHPATAPVLKDSSIGEIKHASRVVPEPEIPEEALSNGSRSAASSQSRMTGSTPHLNGATPAGDTGSPERHRKRQRKIASLLKSADVPPEVKQQYLSQQALEVRQARRCGLGSPEWRAKRQRKIRSLLKLAQVPTEEKQQYLSQQSLPSTDEHDTSSPIIGSSGRRTKRKEKICSLLRSADLPPEMRRQFEADLARSPAASPRRNDRRSVSTPALPTASPTERQREPTDSIERRERTDSTERWERMDNMEQREQTDKTERKERTDSTERRKRTDKTERRERTSSTERRRQRSPVEEQRVSRADMERTERRERRRRRSSEEGKGERTDSAERKEWSRRRSSGEGKSERTDSAERKERRRRRSSEEGKGERTDSAERKERRRRRSPAEQTDDAERMERRRRRSRSWELREMIASATVTVSNENLTAPPASSVEEPANRVDGEQVNRTGGGQEQVMLEQRKLEPIQQQRDERTSERHQQETSGERKGREIPQKPQKRDTATAEQEPAQKRNNDGILTEGQRRETSRELKRPETLQKSQRQDASRERQKREAQQEQQRRDEATEHQIREALMEQQRQDATSRKQRGRETSEERQRRTREDRSGAPSLSASRSGEKNREEDIYGSEGGEERRRRQAREAALLRGQDRRAAGETWARHPRSATSESSLTRSSESMPRPERRHRDRLSDPDGEGSSRRRRTASSGVPGDGLTDWPPVTSPSRGCETLPRTAGRRRSPRSATGCLSAGRGSPEPPPAAPPPLQRTRSLPAADAGRVHFREAARAQLYRELYHNYRRRQRLMREAAAAAQQAGPLPRRTLAVETVLADSVEAVRRRERLLRLEEDILEELLFLLPRSLSVRLCNVSPEEGHANSEIELTEAKVLEIIEQSYPNPVTVHQMAKQTYRAEEEIQLHLSSLTERGTVRPLESGGYTRVQENEAAVTVVKQMPTVVSSQQPTIAIITANYCEKLAVDAMIVNKETFVRFTTVGESNVYTLGNIGAHRVVSTKLPTVGHTRGAVIAAGSSTTRLLGCFQAVEHVFLVGLGGGVPHYTDYARHVRLGDVVVAAPTKGQRFIYLHCERASELESGAYEFETKSWGPPSLDLQNIAELLKQQGEENPEAAPWVKYMSDGEQKLLEQDAAFQRPPDDTDKLYMAIGEKDVIEVAHPAPADSTANLRERGRPVVHLGPVASGRQVVSHDQMRQEFSSQVGILAYDAEFDSVVESIYGNRKDNYIFIRGIADYKDGTRGREWQPYASLAAASFMKAIICAMDPPKST